MIGKCQKFAENLTGDFLLMIALQIVLSPRAVSWHPLTSRTSTLCKQVARFETLLSS